MLKTNSLLGFALTTAFLILSNFVYGVSVKGRVTDEQGAALSFATVYVKGTTNGTSANEEGYFYLDLSVGTHSITAQLMGYSSATKTVELKGETVTVNFSLQDQSHEMKEITIKSDGEDPAYAIMRKVIAARKEHARKIKSLETEIYLKGVLKVVEMPTKILGIDVKLDSKESYEESGLDSLGRGIVYLLEQVTKFYRKEPNKEMNQIVSIRESGDPKGIGFATMPPIINIYENNLTILNGLNKRGFLSPANTNALLYYNFQFLGSYMDGDNMINKIKVIPKRKFEPLFSGYVYVVENKWVFQSVDLLLTQTSQMEMLDTLKLKQSYLPDANNNWIINSQVLYPALKTMGIGINGNFVTVYKHTKINEAIADSIFVSKTISVYDTTANSKTKDYWDTIRPIPLDDEEVKNFAIRDSLYEHNQHKLDSLSKRPITNLKFSDFLATGPFIKRGANTWSMTPLINSVGYNTVEGLNATLGLHWRHALKAERSLKFSLYNRYGFVNNRYNLLATGSYYIPNPKWKERYSFFKAEGGQYVFQLNNQNPINAFMNDLYTLFGGKNYMKLYQQQYGKIAFSRNWGTGLNASMSLQYARRLSLENTTDYTFDTKNKQNLTPNNPEAPFPAFEAHNAAIVTVDINWQPGWKYIEYPKFKQPISSSLPTIGIQYTKGIPNLFNSKSDFDKWQISLKHSFGLRLLGTIDYQAIAGGFFNSNYVGVPDMKHLMGNRTFRANPYLSSFQLAPYYKFSNTEPLYAQGHIEWHLNGWLTNKIPAFRALNWHLVAASNIFYLNTNNYYAEVSVGLENIGYKIFRLGRVDFIAGYESGIKDPIVGVRLGISSDVFRISSNND